MNFLSRLLFTCFCFSATFAHADRIELVVPHGPGGVSDLSARAVSKFVPNSMVVNRPGGHSQIGIQYIKKNSGVLIATATQVFVGNRFIIKDLAYDPDRDLEIIATIGVMPSVLICNKNSGINSIEDLKRADKMSKNFAIGGYGSNEHLATEILFHQIGKKQQLVAFPQSGSSQLVAVIGNHVDCLFSNYPTVKNQLEHANINVILISHDIEKKVATWQEVFGSYFPLQSYSLLVIPKNLGQHEKRMIRSALQNVYVAHKKEINEKLSELGLFADFSTQDENIKKVIDINQSIVNFVTVNRISLIP